MDAFPFDPDEQLRRIRAFRRIADVLDGDEIEVAFHQLVRLLDDLDAWITAGGYLPARWSVACLIAPPPPEPRTPEQSDITATTTWLRLSGYVAR